MRKLLPIVILAVSMFTISAQDTFVFPVKFEQEALTIDTIFADNIEVEVLEYRTAYIPDNEQYVFHYMDYEAGEWKYIDYPVAEPVFRRDIRVTDESIVLNTENESWVYSFETKAWRSYEPPPRPTYDPTEFDNTPEPFMCEPDEDDTGWYYADASLGIYTYCNAETLEYIDLTSETINENCGFTDFRRLNIATFYGSNDDVTTIICSYDFDTRTFVNNGIIDKVLQNPRGRNNNGVYWLFNYLELENSYQFGLGRDFIFEIFRFDISQPDSIENIVDNIPIPILISNNPGQRKLDDLFYFGAFYLSDVYLWAEQISETEEAIYKLDLNIGEPELLFTREHENQGHKFYHISLSPDENFVRIQEPIIYRTGLESVELYFYSRDGQLLRHDSFTSRFPHTDYSFWRDDTYFMFSDNYIPPSEKDNPWAVESPIYIYDFAEDGHVDVSQVVDFTYYDHSETLLIDDLEFWVLRDFNEINIYSPESRVQLPFINISPRDYCIELTPSIRTRELYLTIWQNPNCETFSYSVFSAVLNISINPSGEDDGG